jgi:hypothetical protein
MLITCPACGADNDWTYESNGKPSCFRCESPLRADSKTKSRTPAKKNQPQQDEQQPPKNHTLRNAIIGTILFAKVILILIALGRHGKQPNPAAPAQAFGFPQPGRGGPGFGPGFAPMRAQQPRQIMSYELFEPEEVPSPDGALRTFHLKANKLQAGFFERQPVLRVRLGQITRMYFVDPQILRKADTTNIEFSIPKDNILEGVNELVVWLEVAEPNNAIPRSGIVVSPDLKMSLKAH